MVLVGGGSENTDSVRSLTLVLDKKRGEKAEETASNEKLSQFKNYFDNKRTDNHVHK